MKNMYSSVFKYPTMSKINREAKEEYWIRLYLNQNLDYIEGAIDRAYLDFARTQHSIKKDIKPRHLEVKKFVKALVTEIQTKTFNNQNQFDRWHEEKCKLLKAEYKKLIGYPLTIGQAQKWINMTLKYLFALGEDRVKGILTNYKFFHIPIDNIIQDKLRDTVDKIDQSWSTIDDYSLYLDYQKKVRRSFPDEIPMDVEFRSWMYSI